MRGVIAREPGRRVGAFSFGTRVLIDYDDLRATGLLTFGSRASYQLMLRVKEDGVRPLVTDLRRDLRNDFVNARSYQSTEDDIGEDLLRAENYLSLVGFIMVILGGIGVWSVTRVFVRQKVRSVAILKCLGATTRQVLTTYVVQVVLLGLAGSLLGVAIAAVAIASIPAVRCGDIRRRVLRADGVGDTSGRRRRRAGFAAVLARAAARGSPDEAAPAAARDGHVAQASAGSTGSRSR